MNSIFLDSNVVLYLLSADSNKADQAEALLAAGPTISVQVLSEVTSVCLCKLKMPWSEVRALLDAIKANCQIVSLTLQTHERAMDLAQRYQLSFFDAQIAAAAQLAGAKNLLSEDMHSELQLQGLQIQNPFAKQ